MMKWYYQSYSMYFFLYVPLKSETARTFSIRCWKSLFLIGDLKSLCYITLEKMRQMKQQVILELLCLQNNDRRALKLFKTAKIEAMN